MMKVVCKAGLEDQWLWKPTVDKPLAVMLGTATCWSLTVDHCRGGYTTEGLGSIEYRKALEITPDAAWVN